MKKEEHSRHESGERQERRVGIKRLAVFFSSFRSADVRTQSETVDKQKSLKVKEALLSVMNYWKNKQDYKNIHYEDVKSMFNI